MPQGIARIPKIGMPAAGKSVADSWPFCDVDGGSTAVENFSGNRILSTRWAFLQFRHGGEI